MSAKVYDYIIIGAGSSGCVLANRLSANPQNRVLLLEAGGSDRRPMIQIPAGFSKLFRGPCDWNFSTEPQIHLNGRQLYWPRGKVLGGCSSINVMIYTRGDASDYDNWNQLGNKGWGYQSVLPYFKKSENNSRGPSFYHGAEGPLSVTDLIQKNPISEAFVESGIELGLLPQTDFNLPHPEGIGFHQVTQRNGRRHSSAQAYLKPALTRPNLSVVTQAHVTQIIFSKQRAVGVRYATGNQEKSAQTEGEVLLCAGAVQSPQILLLSGIGPAEHLQSFKIPVIQELPGVGENLQDHLLVGISYQCRGSASLDKAGRLPDLLRYMLFQNGPLTSNIGEAGAFFKTASHLKNSDIQLQFVPTYYMNHGFLNPKGYGFSLGAALLRPQSRGHVRLRSSNPFDPPKIDPSYLCEKPDLDTLFEGLKLTREILRGRPLEPFRGEEVWPGKSVDTEKKLKEYIRDTAETYYHPVGTCKMGNDGMAVVDSALKVHGVEGLRVIDASIMPAQIGGNPNAPTMMIAEKAADLILNNFNLERSY